MKHGQTGQGDFLLEGQKKPRLVSFPRPPNRSKRIRRRLCARSAKRPLLFELPKGGPEKKSQDPLYSSHGRSSQVWINFLFPSSAEAEHRSKQSRGFGWRRKTSESRLFPSKKEEDWKHVEPLVCGGYFFLCSPQDGAETRGFAPSSFSTLVCSYRKKKGVWRSKRDPEKKRRTRSSLRTMSTLCRGVRGRGKQGPLPSPQLCSTGPAPRKRNPAKGFREIKKRHSNRRARGAKAHERNLRSKIR
mmetsp:Transcript_9427/g.28461  ORF Transcript_9427/g.28461 Transcript_9427/m.28461 type:complete len:245 (+) Transcript_9427:3505-4239(+)